MRSLVLVLGLFLLSLPWLTTIALSLQPRDIIAFPSDGISGRWYGELIQDARWSRALGNTLIIAMIAVITAMSAGVSLAWSRRTRPILPAIIAQSYDISLGIPAIILGMALLPVVNFALGGSRLLSVGLVHGLMGVPIIYRLTDSALSSIDPQLEPAARGLGATSWDIARHLWLPLIGPAVMVGAALVFVLSINEFIIVLLLTDVETQPIARLIWVQMRYAVSPTAAAASTILLLIAAIVVMTTLRRSPR